MRQTKKNIAISKRLEKNKTQKKSKIFIISNDKLKPYQKQNLLQFLKSKAKDNSVRKIPNMIIATAAILQNNKIVGHISIYKKSIKNLVKTDKTYTHQIQLELQTTSIVQVLQPILLDYLNRMKINKLQLWTSIEANNMELITKLLNSGWMFAKKEGDFNIYIIDYRIGKHQHLSPSRDLKKYQRKFIMSVKKVNPDLNYEILEAHMVTAGLGRTKDPKSRPIILYTEALENNMISRDYYYTECYIMNILSKEHQVITNKYWLYLNFNKMFPEKCEQYLAKTMDIQELDPDLVLKKHKVYIARPVGHLAWSGHGIVVVSDKESLDKALAGLDKFQNIIASEYILNPFLYQGKKTHLRCFLLASIIDGVYSTWLFDFYRLYHAKLPFIHGDWENKDIHDTHLKSTSRNMFGPDDLDLDVQPAFRTIVWEKMQDCMRHVSMILEGHCVPYENAANAFEIFGCDIMVRDNYDITLIEVNEHTGLDLKPEPEKIREFSEKYFGCINDMIINPIIRGIPCSTKPLYTKKLGK